MNDLTPTFIISSCIINLWGEISTVFSIIAGSVGKPKTNKPYANYVIIDIYDTNVEVEIIEVHYDFEKMAKEIEENEILPNDFARLIREGSAK